MKSELRHRKNVCRHAQERYIFSRPLFLINATIVVYLLLVLIASLCLSIDVTSAVATTAIFRCVPILHSRHQDVSLSIYLCHWATPSPAACSLAIGVLARHLVLAPLLMLFRVTKCTDLRPYRGQMSMPR